MQPGGARAKGAVDEQVTGQPRRTGVLEHRTRLRWAGHRLTPVTDHLDAVVDGTQSCQSSSPPISRAGAFVYRDDPVGGRGVQRGQPGFGALGSGQQVPRGGADQVMGVADQGRCSANPVADGSPDTRLRRPVEASAECTSTRAR